MNYIKLALLALLLSACSATPQAPEQTETAINPQANPLQQSEEEKQRYQQAVQLLQQDELQKAREIFETFTRQRPELAGPYANLAIIALKEKNIEQAEKMAAQALKNNPAMAQALNLMAYIEQFNGQIHDAKAHYLQAIEQNPNYALAHYNLALLYDIYFQDVQSAIPYYEKYMALTGHKDKKTADWLEQIKRGTKG